MFKREYSDKLIAAADQYGKEKEYWLGKLPADPVNSHIPYDHHNTPGGRRINSVDFRITGNLFLRLKKIINKSDIRLHIVLVAGLAALIHKYTGIQDIILGTPIYRQEAGDDTQFTNTALALRNQITGDITFKELLMQVRHTLGEANENANYPIETLVHQLKLPASANYFPLFDVVVLLENIQEKSYMKHIPNNLTFSFKRTDEYLAGILDYNSSLYHEGTVQRLSKHLIKLLQEAVFNLDTRISRLSILTEEEREQIVEDFNNTTGFFCQDKSIDHFIEVHAANKPDAVAIGFNHLELSYRQLNQWSDRLAGLLRGFGIGNDGLVAIALERSHLMVIAVLAVWKAGGAYIPLDPHYPLQRLMEILTDSTARVLLTTSEHVSTGLAESYDGKILRIDKHVQEHEPTDEITGRTKTGSSLNRDMSSLAYVIYTSGSTGKPKGAMVEHIGMMNHIWAKIRHLQLTGNSIIAQNASFTFDISLWQFFAAPVSGGKTVIYPNELVMAPDQFISRLINHRVTVLEVVPSYLAVMLDDAVDWYALPLPLDYLLVTGEEIKANLVKKWFDTYPSVKMVNAYGPTEASDDITHYIMAKAPNVERIPLGKPIQNLNIYIVDENMQLCPIGVKGEICVSGVGVGRGYLNNPELTSEKFNHDLLDYQDYQDKKNRSFLGGPGGRFFKKAPLAAGGKLYKTGDLGRWLPDGTIQFFGRKDFQVKIRGHRIELGEIENTLSHHPKIKEAVVIDRENPYRGKYLCAYVVKATAGNDPTTTSAVDTAELKAYLSRYLPDYMVPASIMELEQIPLTANGKINRKALPEPASASHSLMTYITGKELKQAAEDKGKQVDENRRIEKEYQREYVLSKEEREQVLYTFNDTNVEFPGNKTVHEYVEEQTSRTPDRIAAVYKDKKITYHQLNKKANRLAGILESKGVTPNSIVALMLDNSIELMVAIFGILKTAAAFLALDIDYPLKRKYLMIRDTAARFIITRLKYYRDLAGEAAGEYECQMIDIEETALPGDEPRNSEHTRQPGDLAYVVFTSGSTGIPKGTALLHRGLKNLIHWFVREFAIHADDVFLLTTSISFDLTLKNIFAPLFTGAALQVTALNYYMPARVLREIWENQVTCVNFTPGMFYQLMVMEMENEEEIKRLSSLRYLFLGGEVMFVTPLIKWIESRWFNAEIVNAYGPSECTSVSSFYRIKTPGEFYEKPVPLGKPIDNVELFVLSSHFLPLPIGVPGELFIAGEGVGRGYLNDSRLTSEKFITVPVTGPDKRLYRSGDFARWLPDGNIEFLGRRDQQVQVRGLRIETGEIENSLLKHTDIKTAAVVVKEDSHQENNTYLCAYVCARKRLMESDIREYLLRELPLYMIPSYFFQLEQMPLTSNGKVDRKRLAAINIDKNREYKAPGNETEEKLAQIYHETLGVEKDRISIDANFFELGGNSLRAISLIARVHKRLRVKLPLVEIFKKPTIQGLAKYIKDASREQFSPIKAVENKEYYSMSSAQKRLYILWEMEPESTGYNMPEVVVLEGQLNKEKLKQTFRKLILQHESLRTYFLVINQEPVQIVKDKAEFRIEYHIAKPRAQSAERQEERQAPGARRCASTIKDFIRPFDLSRTPLLRVGLIKIQKETHILMADMHHIISDGISHVILLKNFMTLYNGEELPALPLQYKDYSQWQHREKQKGTLQRQKEYWLAEFADQIPVLNLPTDYSRPGMQSFKGDTVNFEIGSEDTRALVNYALREETTLFVILLAIFYILLAKISNREDIVIGTPVGGRRHADLEHIIGILINTLALRNYPAGQQSISAFVNKIKDKTLEAFENQEYPFEELVEQLSLTIHRDTSRSPLFDVMFMWQTMDRVALEIPGLTLSPFPYKNPTSKFDLVLAGMEAGDGLKFSLSYCTKLFKEAAILRFIAYFKQTISALLTNSDGETTIAEIDILPEEERKRLLFDFNATKTAYPKNKTVHELFAEQVERTPDHMALAAQSIGCRAQSKNEKRSALCAVHCAITYRELNEKSNQLASVLRNCGVKPGTIAALMVRRSLEMIEAIFGILKAGGAYLPIDPDYPNERIKYMLKESAASILLTQHPLISRIENGSFAGHILELPVNQWSHDYGSKHNPGTTTGNNPIYLEYTSGSTGKPKGVMIEHRNVINFFHGMTSKIDFFPGKVILALTTICFDIFVLETLLPLVRGLKVILADENQQKDLELLEQVIIKNNVNMLQLTPSVLRLFIGSQKNLKSLPGVSQLMVGGENFPDYLFAETKEKFSGKIYNLYGPTETTVWSTVKDLTSMKEVTIGTPIANTTVYILDRWNRLQPLGVPGELYIGGDGLARGYLNNPELTAEKFIEIEVEVKVEVEEEKVPGKRIHSYLSYMSHMSYIYKTGDLARWLPEGNLQFLGRIDHQVKIRGIRVELGEIENLLLKSDKIKEAVVIAKKDASGDTYLCAYVVPSPANSTQPAAGLNEIEWRQYLVSQLPDHMIPSLFVPLEQIPLTPNGKIDRDALPEPGFQGKETYAAPGNWLEEKLTGLWSDVLGIEKNRISAAANFFHLGGHSLKAMILVSKIHQTLHVKIPLAELFRTPRLRELSKYIHRKGSRQDRYASIEPGEKKEYYILSSSQQRLYILQQMKLESTGYNMPQVIQLEGKASLEKLEKSFIKLIERHESLRTSFLLLGDQPVQRVHKKVEFEIGQEQGQGVEEIVQDLIRPFDLSQAPLLRVNQIKVGKEKYLLLVDIHHILADDISIDILYREFTGLYAGEKLAPLRLHYKDFAAWQHQVGQTVILKQQEKYWLKEFEGEIPVLEIPTDYARPAQWNFAGHTIGFTLAGEVTAALKQYAQEEGATLYMVLLAIYNVFLGKLSSQEDIVIGTPVAGRQHADLEPIVGMFVNTLPLRNYPQVKKTFKELLKEVKANTLEAFENQDYPFEDLLEKIQVRRDKSRNPLFDIVLVMQNVEISAVEIPHLRLTPYRYENKTAKFDLTLRVIEVEEEVRFEFEYSTQLFKKSTLEKFTGYFKRIVSAALENKTSVLSDLEILPVEEKNRILYDLNETAAGYPKDKMLHELFEFQAANHPAHTAVIGGFPEGQHLTYNELNKKSHGLARHLRKKGVQTETIVGIMAEPSLEMMVGIMGILKAGGVYLPLDPNYPEERVNYMLADSNVQFLVTDNPSRHFNCQLSIINHQWDNACSAQSKSPLERGPSSTSSKKFGGGGVCLYPQPPTRNWQLAYVIYTSGTTGKPKGVLIQHKNVIRLMFNHRNPFDFGKDDTWTMFHSFCFDFSVWEMYGALLYGGRLVIIPRLAAREPRKFLQILKNQGVTVLNQTPSAFYNLAEEELKLPGKDLNLKYVIFGGEALKPVKLKKWKEKYPGTKLINMFGITETTVHVTYKEMDEREIRLNTSNIGKPIPTLNTYIMDKNAKLLPLVVAGELCVGGDGVGRGYLNRVELTAEKFVENPYKPGQRLYRSGDLAKFADNGDLEYLGRIDNQIKIRGFRIEPGEIESQLLRRDQVKEAVVLAREKEAGSKYLCAYIVANLPQPPFAGASPPGLTPSHLREYLATSLPDYMIPAYFVILDQLPLTANGKIDRDALPYPSISLEEERYVAPRNESEKKLARIWAKVLELERVGINDNYFNIGGDSIKAIKLLNEINTAFNTDMKIVDLFGNDTIKALSEKITTCKKPGVIAGLKEAFQQIAALKDRIMAGNKLPGNVEDVYPMSDIEKGMVFYSLKDTHSALYHDQFVYQRKYPAYDAAIFTQALRFLVEKHPILRTSFNLSDFEEPVQIVQKRVPVKVPHFDISHLEKSQQQEFIKKILQEDRKKTFNISVPPLWRMIVLQLGNNHICTLWIFHHAILDGWSNASFITELNNTYLALKSDPNFVPAKLKNTYKAFVARQIADKQKDEVKDYWKNELEDYKRLDFPKRWEINTGPNIEKVGIYEYELSTGLLKELIHAAGKNNIILQVLLFGAYVYMLNMKSFENDILVGRVTHNRPVCDDGDKILGCFLNTVPVRVKIPAGINWLDYFSGIEKTIKELKPHEKLPLLEILKVIGESPGNGNPLFDTIYNYIDFFVYGQAVPDDDANVPMDDGQRLSVQGYENTNTLFDFTVNTSLGGFSLHISYSESILGLGEVRTYCNYFEAILKEFVRDPQGTARKDKIIPEEEKETLLYTFNKTGSRYPNHKTVHELFADQVIKQTGHTALIFEDKHLTYEELNKKANQLARVLKEKGASTGSILAVMLHRSIEMMVSIFAVLKTGGAYLPIDPTYPPGRVKYILEDSAVKLLLSRKDLYPGLTDRVELLDLENISLYGRDDNNEKKIGSPGDLAYALYTSGSTGNPKGVLVNHGSVVNILYTLFKEYPFSVSDVYMMKTSYLFDVSVSEMFGWFLGGGRLILLENEGEKDPQKILNSIERQWVTHINFVPSMFRVFMDFLDSQNINGLPGLKYIFLAGEALSSEIVNNFAKRNNRILLENIYGPTEATIYASRYSLRHLKGANQVPIGKPLNNIKLYILDRQDNLQPVGAPGELCISGKGLARGYLNNPELTAEKFDHDLWDSQDDQDKRKKVPGNRIESYRSNKSYRTYISKKIYKTGDLVRWLPDGNIEFFGRMDHQVKIRGFRVELEEIETLLLQHDKIKEAVVISKSDQKENKYLEAYVVPIKNRPAAAPGNQDHFDPNTLELNKYLLEKLPYYMVPSHFVQLEELPVTASGKIDRKALPALGGIGLKSGIAFVSPRDALEEILVNIWKNLLGRDTIGIDDNFFMLGGDSIKAVQVVSRMNNAGYTMEVRDIFQAPSIAQLAPRVKKIEQQADQSPVEGMVPLTPIQKAFFIGSRRYPHHYNQAVMLYSKDGFDEEGIKTVFTRIQAHHDALRTIYVKDNGTIRQITRGLDYPFSFDVFDYRNQVEVLEGFETKVNEIQASIDLEKGPLMKLGLFHLDDGDRLLVVFHHLVMDGISWRILFEDIEALYRQYINGEPLVLPLKTDSFKLWSEKLSQYANSVLFLEEKKYWKELESINVPPILKDLAGDNRTGNITSGSFTLSEKETNLLVTRVNEAFATEINDILLTGLGLAIKKTYGITQVLVALEGHGREEILENINISRTVGWFTTVYPVVLNLSFQDDLARQIIEVKENLHQVPNKGTGYGILKYLTADEYKTDIQFRLRPQICFNYFGQFDSDIEQMSFELARESIGNFQSPEDQGEYELDVSGMISAKRLLMSIAFNKHQFKGETINTLLNHYQKALSDIISYCTSREKRQLTPSDFTYKELSLEEIGTIDALFTNIL